MKHLPGISKLLDKLWRFGHDVKTVPDWVQNVRQKVKIDKEQKTLNEELTAIAVGVQEVSPVTPVTTPNKTAAPPAPHEFVSGDVVKSRAESLPKASRNKDMMVVRKLFNDGLVIKTMKSTGQNKEYNVPIETCTLVLKSLTHSATVSTSASSSSQLESSGTLDETAFVDSLFGDATSLAADATTAETQAADLDLYAD